MNIIFIKNIIKTLLNEKGFYNLNEISDIDEKFLCNKKLAVDQNLIINMRNQINEISWLKDSIDYNKVISITCSYETKNNNHIIYTLGSKIL